MSDDIHTFDEFYSYYLAHHANRTNRLLHAIGTISALVLLITFFSTGNWWFLPAVPLAGYGCAWLGHLLFEHNQPTALRYPWWSFLSDWRMVGELLTGRIQAHSGDEHAHAQGKQGDA